jgi:hypothetical protein
MAKKLKRAGVKLPLKNKNKSFSASDQAHFLKIK